MPSGPGALAVATDADLTFGHAACTFDKPSHRPKSAPLETLRAVERRLRRAEALIHRLVPHCDLQKAGLAGLDLAHLASFLGPDSSHQRSGSHTGETLRGGHNSDDLEDDGVDGYSYENDYEPDNDNEDGEGDGSDLVPLSEKVGRVDLNEHGEWDFHGLSSDAAYLGRIARKFPELMGYDARTPFLPQAAWPLVMLPNQVADHAPGFGGLPAVYQELPPQALARKLCEYSLRHATCVLQTVHGPSFYRMFNSIYDTPAPLYSSEQHRFLGLLYAVLALGSMYDVDERDPSNPDHYAVAMNLG